MSQSVPDSSAKWSSSSSSSVPAATAVGSTRMSSAPVLTIASVLTAGAVAGHDDRGLDLEQRGRVGDGEPVVAARVGDDAVGLRRGGPLRLEQSADRVVGAAQLERTGLLQRFGLNQQVPRGTPRTGSEACGRRRQPPRRGAHLVNQNQLSYPATLTSFGGLLGIRSTEHQMCFRGRRAEDGPHYVLVEPALVLNADEVPNRRPGTPSVDYRGTVACQQIPDVNRAEIHAIPGKAGCVRDGGVQLRA